MSVKDGLKHANVKGEKVICIWEILAPLKKTHMSRKFTRGF